MLSFTFSNPLQSSREIIIKIRSAVLITSSKGVCGGKFEKNVFQKQTESLVQRRYYIITKLLLCHNNMTQAITKQQNYTINVFVRCNESFQ